MSETWTIGKAAVASEKGIVAAQNHHAARAGAEILAAGGNAVDAAVATAFALGVVEPWMSGIGGGGLLVWAPAEGPVEIVDFTMEAPSRLDPGRYKPTGARSRSAFAWPEIEGDRNLEGWESILVPGTVDGLGLALERFGRKSLAEAIGPALRLAEEGMPLDWHTTLAIAISAAELARYPSSRAHYLPEGVPPSAPEGGARRLPLPGLAATYRRLAAAGRRDFYEGALAQEIAGELAEGGSVIRADDHARYRAAVKAPLAFDYRDVRVHLAPDLTGGPTLARILGACAERLRPGTAPDAQAYATYAAACREAFAHRLAAMGHAAGGNTTHLSAIDRDGNVAALTNTLLSRFGSKVLLPRTGITMNNGAMWFDPTPGRPNSMAPGKRPLANMCPTVLTRRGAPWVGLGACGGRKIIPAVAQLVSFLVDYGMPLERAAATPRIEASTATIVGDPRLDPATIDALARAWPVEIAGDAVYPNRYAIPSLVQRDGRINRGTAYLHSPVAAAIAEA
jgi:gamma-glutamyltranspeptidase/glutathione hydrolase